MTEVSNQQQRGGLLVPTLLTTGAGVGGYYAAEKYNVGVPKAATSWEEIVTKVNGDDQFIQNKIDNAKDADVKAAWEKTKDLAQKAKDADDKLAELFTEAANKDSKEVKNVLKAADELEAAKKALKEGEAVEQKFVDALENAKNALKEKNILKEGVNIDDVIAKNNAKKAIFDNTDEAFKKIKLANKGWTAAAFATAGLILGLLLRPNKNNG